MKIHELDSVKRKGIKRVGRGISAGGGKTAGRGTKGQNSRTGKKLRAGFEGGQNPLMMRIPKLKGFRSLRQKAQVVYTDNLATSTTKKVDNHSLFADGLISSPYQAVKIISRGQLKKTLTIETQGASASAVKAIEEAGGSFKKVDTSQRLAAEGSKKAARVAKKSADRLPTKPTKKPAPAAVKA